MRRTFCILIVLLFLCVPVTAEPLRWVSFDVPYESLHYAMETDINSAEQELHIGWVEALAVAACRTGGKCGLSAVKKAVSQLKTGASPQELLGDTYKYYDYYHTAYQAVLGGLLGSYSIETESGIKSVYGLKAFNPIASGYGYSHSDDFGNARSFGFKRKHLGHDMMGSTGTPIVAVEGGIVEAMGWNRYGGWRIGIRSSDSKRYYYYAHLQKDKPFAPGLQVGDIVQPGELIGFMGRTGYSDRENVNNIQTVHLHFGMQLVFDESQKECLSEIWIDPYNIVRLLDSHRSTVVRNGGDWSRKYPFVDLDTQDLF